MLSLMLLMNVQKSREMVAVGYLAGKNKKQVDRLWGLGDSCHWTSHFSFRYSRTFLVVGPVRLSDEGSSERTIEAGVAGMCACTQ